MEGEPCVGEGDFYCEPRLSGGGKLLQCMMGTWELGTGVCPQVCTNNFPAQPNFIGCAGDGAIWVCLCQAGSPPACDAGVYNGCMGNMTLNLCVDGEEAIARCAIGDCTYTDPDTFTCS